MTECNCLLCRVAKEDRAAGLKMAEAACPGGTQVYGEQLRVAVAAMLSQLLRGQPKAVQIHEVSEIASAALKLAAMTEEMTGGRHGPLH